MDEAREWLDDAERKVEAFLHFPDKWVVERGIRIIRSLLAENERLSNQQEHHDLRCPFIEKLKQAETTIASHELMSAEADSFLSGMEVVPEGTQEKLEQAEAERDALAKFVKGVRHNDYWPEYQALPASLQKEIEDAE